MGKRDVGTHRDEDQRVSSDTGGRGCRKGKRIVSEKKVKKEKKSLQTRHGRDVDTEAGSMHQAGGRDSAEGDVRM